jgi:hypothetical protein
VVCVALLTACGSDPPPDDSSSPGPGSDLPPVTDPAATVALPPGTTPGDCAGATVPASVSSELVGLVEASTDPSGASLLVKNTSLLTLIVVPGTDGATTLQPTPELNPGDDAHALALEALVSSNIFAADTDVPPGVPANQVYVVPPDYSVCGTTSDSGGVASVRIQRDRLASAAWRLGFSVTQKLVGLFTPAAIRSARTISTCVNGSIDLLRSRPDLSDFTFYDTALGTASTCYSGVSGLLRSAGEPAAEAPETRSVLLKGLKRLPQMVEDGHFLLQLARLR